jgi:hypothetical protein
VALVSSLQLRRRGLTPAVRPPIFAFTSIEAPREEGSQGLVRPGEPLPLALSANQPVLALHGRLYAEADGNLVADLGQIAFQEAPNGGLSAVALIPHGLLAGRLCLVIEGRDDQGRAAGCEVSLQVS